MGFRGEPAVEKLHWTENLDFIPRNFEVLVRATRRSFAYLIFEWSSKHLKKQKASIPDFDFSKNNLKNQKVSIPDFDFSRYSLKNQKMGLFIGA